MRASASGANQERPCLAGLRPVYRLRRRHQHKVRFCFSVCSKYRFSKRWILPQHTTRRPRPAARRSETGLVSSVGGQTDSGRQPGPVTWRPDADPGRQMPPGSEVRCADQKIQRGALRRSGIGGMMKEPTWGVKSAYGRVTPPVGSFNPINRNISRFRKI